MAAVADCFLADRLPVDRNEFHAVIRESRGEFISTANAMAELTHKILKLFREVRDRLQYSKVPQEHRDDCLEQCDYLVYEGFVRDIPPRQLLRLPVYFQAILKRMDKSEQNLRSADRALPVVRSLWQQYLDLESAQAGTAEQLQQIRWLIEEFRISCFAQPMKTRGPVSENRIRKLIHQVRDL